MASERQRSSLRLIIIEAGSIGRQETWMRTIFTNSSNSFQYPTLLNIAHVETGKGKKPVWRCVVYVIYTVIKKSFTAGCNFLNPESMFQVAFEIFQVFVVTLDRNIL